jgi:hypothetical protein
MMRASIKQVSIPIPTLVKCFSLFLSESDDLSFERVCSVGRKKTYLKIVVAFHPKHEWILVSNFVAMF